MKTDLHFEKLKLRPELLKALRELGLAEMTPIQSATIPLLLNGYDVIGQSKTGSGKTAAFVLPILQKLILKSSRPQALILCPTRELCEQVFKETSKFAKHLPNFKSVSLSGGQPALPQADSLKHGAQLVVGTPGRTLEFLKQGYLQASDIQFLVLDEADRLMEDGFLLELDSIISFLPKKRQTVFFSATFPEHTQSLSLRYQTNPKSVHAENQSKSPASIQHFVYHAEKPDKLQTLQKILKDHSSSRTVIFCRTKKAVNEIGALLKNSGVQIQTLHSDLPQAQRDQAMKLFRNGNVQILVATDVASRGLDIEGLQLVINFDLPPNVEIYTHRIGRTGRAGKTGVAISIMTEYEAPLVQEFETALGLRMTSK